MECSNPQSAYIQYKSFRIDLLSGEKAQIGAHSLFDELENEKLSENREMPLVVHMFYELGYLTQNLEDLIKESSPLAIVIEYSDTRLINLNGTDQEALNVSTLQYPKFDAYKKSFDEGMEKLLDGDCYQFNLTRPFFFSVDKKADHKKIIQKAFGDLDKVSAYAHCTFVGTLNKLFISNSPECLFQYKSGKKPKLYSMPIKGTIKSKDKDRKRNWKKLKASMKDQAELYMITDLVRNDLTRAQLVPAKIVAKKLALNVPGIVHQYSLVAADAKKDLNAKEALMALFPGGSITGAPKKRVMQVLRTLEDFDRGFYCGSTLILHRSMKAASINIRSCEIDCSNNEMKYCAGGGITLNSESKAEFEEAYIKLDSFLKLLK